MRSKLWVLENIMAEVEAAKGEEVIPVSRLLNSLSTAPLALS